MTTIALSKPIKSKAAAIKITGSLGKPSKMPGLSYGISATLCKIGSALAKVKGSTCENCYALKANYAYPSVKAAHEKRRAGIEDPQWADAMVYLIGSSGFRRRDWGRGGSRVGPGMRGSASIAGGWPSVWRRPTT